MVQGSIVRIKVFLRYDDIGFLFIEQARVPNSRAEGARLSIKGKPRSVKKPLGDKIERVFVMYAPGFYL